MTTLVPPRRVVALSLWGLLVGLAEIAAVTSLFLLGLTLASGGTLPDVPLRATIADAIAASGLGLLPALALALVAAVLARAAVGLAFEAHLRHLQGDVVLGATDKLFTGYFGMEYARFTGRNSADRVLHLTTELDRAGTAVMAWARMMAMLVVLVLMAGLLILLDWRAALLGTLTGVSIGSAAAVLMRRTSSYARRHRDAQKEVSISASEAMRAYRDLATSGLWPRFQRRVRQGQEDVVRLNRRVLLYQNASPHALEIGVALSVLVVIALATLLGDGSSSATPVLVLLVAGAYRILPAMQRFLTSLSTFRINHPSLRATVAELEEVHRHARHHRPEPLVDMGDVLVSLREVRFAHPLQDALLTGIDLEVRRGERLGIIGPSGSGKTTLIDLILGLLRPTHGVVLRGLGKGDHPARFAYLPQQPAFVQGTVLDNLALPDEATVDEDEARRLLDLVGLGHVPLDLQLSEAGGGLSGGERQRLGLARALHGSPDLLLLDEPTGALDAATEQEVLEALGRIHGLAMLVVTHRPAPLALCDRVERLEAGTLVPNVRLTPSGDDLTGRPVGAAGILGIPEPDV